VHPAEDLPHDMGATSTTSRPGDGILRTWQFAHEMKRQRGRPAVECDDSDFLRARRIAGRFDQPSPRASHQPAGGRVAGIAALVLKTGSVPG
jgi:urease alpha subunit